jgi:16S rRNA A1518/A1519 N6-dimethyltransferase RsmA/KsgA/DIM1 with predicted DNA glycosylase/AP lyase activity
VRPARDRRRPPPRRDPAPAPTAANQAQQHDLRPEAARKVAEVSGVRGGHVVLEVGAGTGELTAALLARGATVQAVELDPARVERLRTRFAAELADRRLVLHAADMRGFAPRLAPGWRVVANPPFNLTASLVRGWLLERNDPAVALDLVLQREAGEKLTGAPAAHNRSSALAALAGTPRFALRLQRDQVSPPSRVDLCVWSWRRHPDAPAGDELERVDRLLAIAFAGPRTMAEALRGVATGIQIRRQAAEHGWDPAAHPRAVPPRAWLPFAALLAMCGKL